VKISAEKFKKIKTDKAFRAGFMTALKASLKGEIKLI